MRVLVITFIIQTLISKFHCIQPTHVDHMCSGGASTEQAGKGSGTVTFDGAICELTITDIPEFRRDWDNTTDQLINIVGVRRNESCDISQIVIDSETYCVDESVTDTVINATDNRVKFAVVSALMESFTLRYYRGEPLILGIYLSFQN